MSDQTLKPSGKFNFLPLAGVITALYLSQGIPGGFIAHALPAYLREEGASLALIGALKLLALPWLLKFLWAPFVDGDGSYSRRKFWIIGMQSTAALALLLLSFVLVSPLAQVSALYIVLLLIINLTSSTQDIATDGLTASSTPKDKLGIANSIQVTGYKVGMMLGGSGLLYLSGVVSVPMLLQGMAVILMCLLIPVFVYRPTVRATETIAPEAPTTLENQKAEETETHKPQISPIAVYRGFLKQRSILPWLMVLLTYKMSDAFGSGMLKPLLVDKGFSLPIIGEINFYASLIGLAGAGLAGIAYRVWGPRFTLLGFCVLQVLTVSSFYFIHTDALPGYLIRGLVYFEQFADGLSTVVLFAIMMRHCRPGHEGADYTFQACIQVLLAGILGALSGIVADYSGYGVIYGLCALFGVISLFFVINYLANSGKNKPD